MYAIPCEEYRISTAKKKKYWKPGKFEDLHTNTIVQKGKALAPPKVMLPKLAWAGSMDWSVSEFQNGSACSALAYHCPKSIKRQRPRHGERFRETNRKLFFRTSQRAGTFPNRKPTVSIRITIRIL